MAIGYADREDVMAHFGHKLEVAYYGDKTDPHSITIECLTCGEVLIDTEEFDEDEDE